MNPNAANHPPNIAPGTASIPPTRREMSALFKGIFGIALNAYITKNEYKITKNSGA